MTDPQPPAGTIRTPQTLPAGQAGLQLGMATIGFAVNFWAWALLSPLGPELKDALGLSSFQQSLVVAVPVIVGSLGRIPVGALTDRYGGRVMFPLVTFVSIVPAVFLGFVHSSLAGAAGRRFLPGDRRYHVRRRRAVRERLVPVRPGAGWPSGSSAAGMGGTAISALTTVKLGGHGFATPRSW
jgi:NNP family nitrate/nitrite transporter-like MFS transporter